MKKFYKVFFHNIKFVDDEVTQYEAITTTKKKRNSFDNVPV